MQKILQDSSPGSWAKWTRQLGKISRKTALSSALLLAGGLYSAQTQAQAVSAYNFAATSGTFTPLGATATALPAAFIDDEAVSSIIPIGFTFNYAGTNYTDVYASSNGFISFNSATGAAFSNSPSGSSASSRPLIAPLWDDHAGYAADGAAASYETTGAVGSRVFTFEWKNWAWNYNASGAVITFQVKLYEGTDKIEFHYRPETAAISSGSASIGLTGTATGSGNFLNLNNATATPTASSTTEFTSISTKPAAGQIYTFSKPVAIDIAATALAAPTTTSCPGQNQTISITVRNAGTAPLDFTTNPLTVNANVTGPNPATFPPVIINTGTLAPGATQNVVVSTTYNMSAAGSYVFNATTAMTGDGFTANNAMAPVTRTVVAPAALPLNVNFTGYTGSNLAAQFPGWSEASGVAPTGTTSDWTNDDFANVTTGTNGISAKINLYSNSFRAWMIGPKVTATANTVLKFDLALTAWAATSAATLGSDDEVKVMVSNDCGATWTAVRTYNAASTISNTGQTEMVSLASYAGQNIMVGFYATDGTTDDSADNDIFIDNIFLGTPPTIDLGVTALTAPVTTGCYSANETVTATITNFTNAALNFATSPATVTVNVTGAATQTLPIIVNTGTLAPNGTLNVNVGSLNMTAAGTYTFNGQVTVAGDGNASNNALPATTRTVTAVATTPQNVDFTGYTGSNLTTVFPNWSEAAGATAPSGTSSGWTNRTGLGSSTNVTAKMNLYTTGQNEWIVGPKVAATSGTFFIFKAAITDYNNLNPDPNGMDATDKVQVMVSTNCGATFTPVYTMDATNTTTLTNVLTEQRISLGAYAGQNIIVALFATGGAASGTADYDFHVDDLSIATLPAVDLGVTALASPVTFNGCYGTSQNVSVAIRNLGSAPLDFAANNANISVNVTGAATQSFPLLINSNTLNNGNPLAIGATLIVPVGTLNMSALGAYSINASVAATGDGDATNNAMSPVTITVAAPVGGTASASIPTICQSGTTTLNLAGYSGGDIQWQSGTSATGPFTNITGANSATFTTPTLTQTTYYQAVISCGTASATSTVATVTVNNPTITASADGASCGAGTVALSATPSAGATINWYSAATGGTPLASGNTYSPNVTATTTYYAEASTGVTEKAGKMSTTGADGTNTGGGLIFNASSPFTLDSVVVYSALSSGGSLIVNLTDAAGTVLQTTTVTLPGVSTRTAIVVPLNFSVPAGTGLKLVQGSSLGLYRDYSATAGISYPYTSPSQLVTITDGTLAGYYYFFYRWSISTKCSPNSRTAVVATINATPATPTITRNGFVLTSSSATGNQWYLNGTAITGATGQTYTSTANGAYTVVVTTNGCASAASAALNITNTGIKDALAGMKVSIYPNPNNGAFNVKLEGYKQAASLELYSLTGQLIVTETVKAGQEVKPMKVNNLAKGTYLLKVISEKGAQVSRIVVE